VISDDQKVARQRVDIHAVDAHLDPQYGKQRA